MKIDEIRVQMTVTLNDPEFLNARSTLTLKAALEYGEDPKDAVSELQDKTREFLLDQQNRVEK